jgi:glycosyltransferase involved in cell wall biosynthesis
MRRESSTILLVLNTELGVFGGTETNAVAFAGFLREQGARPVLLQVGRDVLSRQADGMGIESPVLPTDDFRAPRLATWRTALRLYAPDVIVLVKNWYDSRNPYLDLAALMARVRRIVWEHHPAPTVPDDHWGTPGSSRWWRRRVGHALHYRGAHRVVAISEAVRMPLEHELGVHRSRVALVYPGIDFARFIPDANARDHQRRVWGIADDQVVLGAIGRLVPHKRLHVLLHVLAALRPQFGDRLVGLLGGEGPDRSRLLAAAEAMGVADMVRFPGWIESNVDGWRAIDIAMLPSENEGLGIALIEAAASGSVPFAADCEGMREVLHDELSGFRIAGDDLTAFSTQVGAVVAMEQAERQALASHMRRVLARRFDARRQWAAMAAVTLG